MKKLVSIVILMIVLSACSTSGGIYKKGSTKNGEFSAEKTVLTVIGVIGSALLMKNNSGYDNNDYMPYQYDDSASNALVTPTATTETITTSEKEVQLAELQRLLDNNLITKEIYFERMKKIIRTIGR